MNKARISYILLMILIWLSISGSRPLPLAATNPLSGQASIAAAPIQFGKQSPANGAVNQPTSTITLQWQASSENVAYEYCLRTNKKSCPRPKWISVGANTSVTLEGLTANTKYYWQVRAVDSSNVYTYADEGMWWQFTTNANPNLPGGFGKLSPEDAGTNQPVNDLELTWNASNLATSYQYCYDTVNNNTCDTSWVGASGLTASVSGLSYNTNYYWQVRAVNASGSVQADYGTWFSFRTMLAPSGAFLKISPGNHATGQPLNITLTWGASPGAGVTYEYCIGTTPCTGASTWIPAGINLSANPSSLQYARTYYWQVRAVNTTATVYADNGTSWSFTTRIAPPQNFGKTSPGNNLTNQPLSLDLTWGVSTGANINYEYCIDTVACTTDSTWLLAGASTSASINGLSYNTTYYWQVRAVNSTSMTYADGGTVWKFTTRAAPPQIFSKLSPVADGLSGMPTNLILEWSPSAGASEYYYCVDTTSHPANDFTCGGVGWVKKTTTDPVPLSLDYNQTYYWQVYAENSQGNLQADNGAWWSFTTIAAPPEEFTKVSPFKGAVDQPLKPWLYWWTPKAPGTTYQYCINTSQDPLGCNWITVAENAPIQPASLNHNTTYYWQVSASRGGNTVEANNEWWPFTTLKAPPSSSNQAFSTDENKSLTGMLVANSNYGKFFTLFGSPPQGTLDFDSDGSFTYTPVPYFNGTVSFQFVVSDAHNPPSDPYTATIAVNPVNNPPTLGSISDLYVQNGKQAKFWAQATDPDLPYGEELTYSIDEALPDGASIDPETGFFNWPKAVYQGSGVFSFTVRVTDQGGLSDTQNVVIVVGKQKIYMPVMFR